MSDWHAPPGYRVVPTDERVDPTYGSSHLTRRRAEREAERLNERRLLPSYEWRAVQHGRRWIVAAFQNRLERIDEPEWREVSR